MHLFAGAGGGLLADIILGHTPVVAIEWDAYCCQVLRERAADGWFPGLHVYEGDVRLFDPSDWAGRVDCIHAGFPCQDISSAGAGAGVDEGTRSGLYREVLRVAGVVRPRYLFLENVAAILNNGLGTVLGDLAARGYDCRWTCLRASDCGAPHKRDRWWLLADSEKLQRDGGDDDTGVCLGGESLPKSRDSSCAMDVADVECIGQPRPRQSVNASGSAPAEDRETTWIEHGCGPDFWIAEPDVGRVAHGVAARVDRLKALGNGQVPLQAALAWKILTEEQA